MAHSSEFISFLKLDLSIRLNPKRLVKYPMPFNTSPLPVMSSNGNDSSRTSAQQHLIFLLGLMLGFSLMDYVSENVNTGDGVGVVQSAKFFYRVIPIAGAVPILILFDYCYCRFGGLVRLLCFPGLTITVYLGASAVASVMTSALVIGGWKTLEAAVCCYWAAIASAHVQQNRLPSPLPRYLLFFVFLTAYSLVCGALFPSESLIYETRAPLPILICLIPTFAQNYLAFVAVYALIGLSIYRYRFLRGWLVRTGLIASSLVVFLLTQTRAAWLSVGLVLSCSIICRLLVRSSGMNLNRAQTFWTLSGIALVLASVFIVARSPELAISAVSRGQGVSEMSKLSGRTAMWSIAKEEIRKRPVWGSGISVAVRRVNRGAEYKSLLISINKKWLDVTPNLHNSILEILMNAGFLGGTMIVLVILIWLPISSFQAICRGGPDDLAAGMLGMVLFVESMALSPLAQGSHAFILLCLLLFRQPDSSSA